MRECHGEWHLNLLMRVHVQQKAMQCAKWGFFAVTVGNMGNC